MNQVAYGSVRWGISKLCSLLETQGKLNHDQRLRFKEDGRPCPPVKTVPAAYQNFAWIGGNKL